MGEWICPRCHEYYYGWSDFLICSNCGYEEIVTKDDEYSCMNDDDESILQNDVKDKQ